MNLNAAEQLQIAEKLAEICGLVSECGVCLPAPVMFVDIADFQNNAGDHSLDTQKQIETSDAALAVITFAKLPRKPAREGDRWTYYYNFYLFREYDGERLDESETPDDFRKKFLKNYYDFVNAILGIYAQIEKERPLEIDSARIKDVFARTEDTDEFIAEDEPCRYIPGVKGFSADIPLEVKVLFQEC